MQVPSPLAPIGVIGIFFASLREEERYNSSLHASYHNYLVPTVGWVFANEYCLLYTGNGKLMCFGTDTETETGEEELWHSLHQINYFNSYPFTQGSIFSYSINARK